MIKSNTLGTAVCVRTRTDRAVSKIGMSWVALSTAYCLLFTSLGCSNVPQKEIGEAEGAIQAARAAGAEKYARADLAESQNALAEAEAKIQQKDYEAAKKSALLAKQKADLAKSNADRQAESDARDAIRKAQKAIKSGWQSVSDVAGFGIATSESEKRLDDLDKTLSDLEKRYQEGDVVEKANQIGKEASNIKNQLNNSVQKHREDALKKDPDDPNEVAVIETKFGKIVLEFFLKDAPNHVANFKKLAKTGFYNGTTFHRVIPRFMIQGGDRNSKNADRSDDGTGDPGYTIDAEFNSRKHLPGTLSMARSSDPNSAGSQFFICVAPVTHLDGKYTVFGQAIEGIDVAEKIVQVQKDRRDNPLERVEMKVSIADRGSL